MVPEAAPSLAPLQERKRRLSRCRRGHRPRVFDGVEEARGHRPRLQRKVADARLSFYETEFGADLPLCFHSVVQHLTGCRKSVFSKGISMNNSPLSTMPKNIAELLSEKIVGQPKAIETIVPRSEER